MYVCVWWVVDHSIENCDICIIQHRDVWLTSGMGSVCVCFHIQSEDDIQIVFHSYCGFVWGIGVESVV